MIDLSKKFWGTGQIPTAGQFFVELFAGEAGLTQAVQVRGGMILPPIELLVNSFVKRSVDVCDVDVICHLHKLVEAGSILAVHMGTPCSSFSLARKDDGGPPPLRDPANIMGKSGLSPQDQEKVDQGNMFAEISAVLAQLCHRHGVPWSIENPAGSYLWQVPAMISLSQLEGVQRFELDMCRFGSPHMKPTALLSSQDLSTLALRCDKSVRPHQHEPLVGKIKRDGKWIYKTRLAQVYPLELCNKWAEAILASNDPLQLTFLWKLDPASRKRPAGQPIEWVQHKQHATAEKAAQSGYQLKRSAMPPLFQSEMEPGQAVAVALDLLHPFTVPPTLDPDLQEALALVVLHPDQTLHHREIALRYWEGRATMLLPQTDLILKQVSDSHLRRLLRGGHDDEPLVLGQVTHIALWQELLSAANCIDRSLVDEILYGFSIVGAVQRSYRWPKLSDTAPELEVPHLETRAWEFSTKVLKNVKRSEVSENTQKIWDSTMEDVAEGVTTGPFFSIEEVNNFVGTDKWIPTQRFEVVQKNKVRGVDSATINGINMATGISEKIGLPSTDTNVAALRWLRSASKGEEIQGWVLDERKAYRQIAIRPDQRRWSVISMREPETGKIAFFVMIGHSFGLVSAVYNYNRRSAAITDVLRRVFKVAAFNFYDDKYGFEISRTCSSAFKCSQSVHLWLGAKFDPKKLQLCSDPTILGVTYDLVSMRLKIKPSRKEELLDEIESIMVSGLLPPGQAGKLRGKLMFGSSQLWGKIGRAFLRSLSERQYSKYPRSEVNAPLQLSLEHWKFLIEAGPPRKIEFTERRKSDYVIFTDGSFPDLKSSLTEPWIGGVLFCKGQKPVQFGCRVSMDLIEKWIPRKSQIAMVEMFATVVALSTFAPWIKDSWSLLFVDSEPVQGALVKGYSSKEDLCQLVGVFWRLALEIQVNLYIDRVPTDSNPADPPSRDQLELGRALGWITIDPVFPEL